MKRLTSKIIISALIFGACHCIVFAQTTISSFTLEKTYSEKQIFSVLGNPTKVYRQEGDYGESLCYYIYKDAEFSFKDGYLFEFSVQTNKYPVMTDKVSGGIKVGDNISKVKKIKNIVYWQPDDDKNVYIINFNQIKNQPDYEIRTKNGIITSIIFSTFD